MEHLEKYVRGFAGPDGRRLAGRDFSDADLFNVRFGKALLQDAIFHDADCTSASFTKAKLNGAKMGGAIFVESDFESSDIRNAQFGKAIFDYANLHKARLQDANLGWATLSRTDVSEANFARSILFATVFTDMNLSLARGLDHVEHEGPSSIGVDTLYRSQGQIPESFLRGAGVPENLIAYLKSLTGAPFEFYSCFISYSERDKIDREFARRLYADLQARGVRCWFAPHDMQGGRKIHEQIDEAIRSYEKLLLIVSDASMNSNWVKTEIANARAREVQQKRQMLFPVSLVPFERMKGWKLFDADTGVDSAREIREYYVPDFSNWKDHDAYTAVFERLVRDLKAQPGDKAAAQASERA